MDLGLELKFSGGQPVLTGNSVIEGYASLFGMTDQGGDRVMPGAFTASLDKIAGKGGKVRMLWQHEPKSPIGVWEEIHEDAKGLWVRGRLLTDVGLAREAAALIEAGAIDGLSIGYRTISAEKDAKGRRCLTEVDLWEVSLVTFPMLPEAKVGRKEADEVQDWQAAFEAGLSALRQR